MNRPRERRPISRLAGVTLGWNVLVILWGAVVRATGSGAGCGAHWPTCNGAVIPLAPSLGTLVEYSHRATSGIALLLVALMTYQAFRHRPSGHPARTWAAASMALILSEAAIGAGLVLFEKVAGDASVARGFWISGHLINTFLLLAALTLTWRLVDAPDRSSAVTSVGVLRATFPMGGRGLLLSLAVLGLVLTGVSGAIAALGDTLFKAGSLREALAQDLSSTSHIFLRLRVLHPVIALVGGGLILSLAYQTISRSGSGGPGRRLGLLLAGLVAGQWFLGVVNLALLAPTPLQIAHLLVADLIWITLISLASNPEA